MKDENQTKYFISDDKISINFQRTNRNKNIPKLHLLPEYKSELKDVMINGNPDIITYYSRHPNNPNYHKTKTQEQFYTTKRKQYQKYWHKKASFFTNECLSFPDWWYKNRSIKPCICSVKDFDKIPDEDPVKLMWQPITRKYIDLTPIGNTKGKAVFTNQTMELRITHLQQHKGSRIKLMIKYFMQLSESNILKYKQHAPESSHYQTSRAHFLSKGKIREYEICFWMHGKLGKDILEHLKNTRTDNNSYSTCVYLTDKDTEGMKLKFYNKSVHLNSRTTNRNRNSDLFKYEITIQNFFGNKTGSPKDSSLKFLTYPDKIFTDVLKKKIKTGFQKLIDKLNDDQDLTQRLIKELKCKNKKHITDSMIQQPIIPTDYINL